MKKILYFIAIFISFILSLYLLHYLPNVDKIRENIYLEKSQSMKKLFLKEVKDKEETTKIFSYLISQDKKIIDALKTDTKDKINFDNIIGFLHENVSYKNLWLQIISKDGETIYRSWTTKQDDSLLNFDDSVKDAIDSRRPIQSISSSEFDLTFNSLQAVYEQDKLIGFIKLISHFNSIAKVLKEQKIEPVFLLSEDKSSLVTEPFTKRFLENNYIANLNASDEIMSLIKKSGIKSFENIENYLNFENYLVSNIKMSDIDNSDLALFLMFINKKDLDLSELSNFKNIYLVVLVIFIVISTLIFLYFLKIAYAKELQKEVILKTEKIKSQQEELQALLTIYDENVIFSKTDLQGVITHISSAFCKISGYTKEELIGKPHNIVRHPDMSKSLFENLWKSLKEKKKVSIEIKNLSKDGSYYWVLADLEPEFDELGEHIGYFAIKKDITASKDIEKIQRDIIFTLGSIAEFRSKDTGEHVKRVAKYSKVLAKAYGLSDEDVRTLEMASPMHDIGKIAIPDKILNKPERLTPSEYEIIKTHAQKGYDMLKVSNRDLFKVASQIALTHHEKYDGTGYPNGLKGEEIPIFGRITALADVFDAVGSDRCYKKAWDLDEVLKYIKDNSGTHFDPKLVDLCFENIDKILEIKEKYRDRH